MITTPRPRIDIQRQSRGIVAHLVIFRRINGPRRVATLFSVLIIAFGQLWSCLRKHRELMRSGRRTRVLLISHSG
jgi:hypothetical protein